MAAKQKSFLFEKSGETLPFFSLHPATLVGRILRIALVFFALVLVVLNLMSKAGLTFMKMYDLYYLVYLVPFILVCGLCITALFKRMNTPIAKILVCGSLGFLVFSIFMTLASMLSVTSGFAWSAKMGFKLEDHGSIVFMRSCVYPEDVPVVVVNEGQKDEYKTEQFTYRTAAYKYTAFPSDGIGNSEGEILVTTSSKFNIETEWLSDDKCRYYLASDSDGLGSGEIIVTFDGTGSASAGADALFRSNTVNKAGTHTANLYREDSYIEQTTNSIYNLTEECFTRVYTAYPAALYFFVKTNVRSEGEITVEPFGNFDSWSVDKERIDDGIIVIRPAETCVGASGEITLYLNQKAVTEESNT